MGLLPIIGDQGVPGNPEVRGGEDEPAVAPSSTGDSQAMDVDSSEGPQGVSSTAPVGVEDQRGEVEGSPEGASAGVRLAR